MADQVAAQSGRPEEPRCYNCGGMGHWTVACPEPTRETPAGLAAWRNGSATRQGGGRAQHHEGRKSKGPIITNLPHIIHNTNIPKAMDNRRHRLRPIKGSITTNLPLTLLHLILILRSSQGHRMQGHRHLMVQRLQQRRVTAAIRTQDKTASSLSRLGQLIADRTRKDQAAKNVIINGHSRLTEILLLPLQDLILSM
ncbi:hypothetical protein V2A60_001575 [Cordyceps javanica]